MRRRTDIPVLVALMAVTGVLAFITYHYATSQPVYEGWNVHRWLDEMTNSNFYISANRKRCEAAFKSMGPKAVPFIFHRITRDDDPFSDWLRRTWPTMPAAIKKWVKQPAPLKYGTAETALYWCGSNSVPLLVQGLKTGPPAIREACAKTLERTWHSNLSTNAALQLFTAALKDDDALVRVFAALALQSFRSAASNAVPDLIANLTHSEAGRHPTERAALHARSADALGKIGPAARPAVPALTSLLKSTDPDQRVSAAVALWRIESNAVSFDVLTNELTSIDKGMRWKIFEGIGEMSCRSNDALPLLNQWMGVANTSELPYITNAIAKFSGSNAPPRSKSSVSPND